MNRLSLWCLTALTALGVAYGKAAEVSEKFVIVHCESPGTLTLSEDALIAPHLKVTGNIDQRDFEALKFATINVTRILDLSETVIHEYTSGNSDTRMDWIIDDPEKITYPADMLPAGAFSELRDNSISKFTRGSSTLKKLILPASLKGFMKGAFTSYSIITDLVVPEGSTTLRQDGKLVYSYDGSTLLAMPPAWFGDVTVASSVTSVADGAFDAATPASVTFTSATPPTLSEGATLSTAYIIAPTPEAYSQTFPDIDCISELETVTLTNLQPGELMGTLGNMGYTRKDVRSIKISGSLSPVDFNALVELPNLHVADLSEATVECESFSTRFTIDNSSIADFKFPMFSKSMILVINATSSLHGDLEVPDRTEVIYNYSKRFRSVSFPSTLYNLGDRSFPEYNVTETLDFSQCSNMKELYLSYATQCLTTLRLPENIESIKYIDGPVKEVNLPGSLKELYGDYWMVDKLVLPKLLETFGVRNLPMVKEIDATEARSLYNFFPLSHAPNLKTLDISMCPIRTIKSLFGASSYSGSVVVSGGTRYPSISINNIESIRFPSTLTELAAFGDCPALKEIDLMHCFRLEKFIGGNNCPSLTSVTLPENLKTIEGLTDCPALTNIKSAAITPPAYSFKATNDQTPLDFSKVSLTVAKDGAGAYRMAEGWENCKEILDDTYRVSISEQPLNGGVQYAYQLLLDGAGLYAPGSEIVLTAYPSEVYNPVGWSINDDLIKSNPCKIIVNGNINAVPDYSFDSNLCDAVIKVKVPERQGVKLTINSARRIIYVDGVKSAWWNYNYSNLNYYIFNLNAGEHEIAIDCDNFTLLFNEVEGTPVETYKVTEFRTNNTDALVELYPRYFDVNTLDLSGQNMLSKFSSLSDNHISTVNISDCSQLKTVSLYDCGLDKLIFDNTPLTDICLGNNAITELDLTDIPDITNLELENNQLKSLDITGLSKLRDLNVSDNQLTEFVYGGNDALKYLYIYNNALPALNLDAFPALEYSLAYGQKLSMTITTDNFDTALLGDNFELSRASRWRARWYDAESGFYLGDDCTLEGATVIIPAEAGNELTLSYDYLISPGAEKTERVEIELTREGFNSVDDLVADGLVTIAGDRVVFADGVEGEVYNTAGVAVFKGYGETGALSKGIYIIRIGASVMKISIP